MMEEFHTSRSPLEAALQEATGEMSFTPIVGSSGMSYRPFMEIGRGGMARVLLARAKGRAGSRSSWS